MPKTIESKPTAEDRVFGMFYPSVYAATEGGLTDAQLLLQYISTPEGRLELLRDAALQNKVEILLLHPLDQVQSRVSQVLQQLGLSNKLEGFNVILKNATNEIFHYMMSYFGKIQIEHIRFPLDFVTMMYMVSNLIGNDYSYYAEIVSKILKKSFATSNITFPKEVDVTLVVDQILATVTELIIERCTDLSKQELAVLNDARFVGHRVPDSIPQLQIKKALKKGKNTRRVGYCELWEVVLEGLNSKKPSSRTRNQLEKIIISAASQYVNEIAILTTVPQVLAYTGEAADKRAEVAVSKTNSTLTFGESLISMVILDVADANYEKNRQKILAYCAAQNFDIHAPLVRNMYIEILKSAKGLLSDTEIERKVVMHTIHTVCSFAESTLYTANKNVPQDLLDQAFAHTVWKFCDIKVGLNKSSNIQDSTRQSMEEVNWPSFVTALNTGILQDALPAFIGVSFRNNLYDVLRKSKRRPESTFSDLDRSSANSGDSFDDWVSNLAVDPTNNLHDAFHINVMIQKVYKFIHNLDNSRKQAFLLARIDGLNYNEIKDLLGIEEGTVKSGMSRAMIDLFILIEQEDPELCEELMEYYQFQKIPDSAEYKRRKNTERNSRKKRRK